MKRILIVFNSIAFTIALAWYIKSNYEYEPLITLITLLVTLIGLVVSANKTKFIKVNGNKNFTHQKDENSRAEINGDGNVTLQ